MARIEDDRAIESCARARRQYAHADSRHSPPPEYVGLGLCPGIFLFLTLVHLCAF